MWLNGGYMCVNRIDELSNFISFLDGTGVIKFDKDDFETRIKVQNLVYLAQVLGVLRTNYSFEGFLYGPYDEELSNDIEKVKLKDLEVVFKFADFKLVAFKELVSGMSVWQLRALNLLVSFVKYVNKDKYVNEEFLRKFLETRGCAEDEIELAFEKAKWIEEVFGVLMFGGGSDGY